MSPRPAATPLSETPVARLGRRRVQIRALPVFGLQIRVATWVGSDSTLPLLVFNGIGAGFELLAPFADAMEGRTVIAFDVPGSGESDPPPLPYRMWMLAVAVGRVLDGLGVDRVDALGVSWGGAAAQQFALQNPRRCRRLVLAATSPGMVMVPPPVSVLAKFLTPRRHNDPEFLHRHAGSIYGGKATSATALTGFRRTSRRGYLYQQLALTGWTSAPWLPFLGQPTLVLAGADDRVVLTANLRILHRLIPRSRLHILPDGHLFILTSARETADLVGPFLDERDP